MTAVNELGFVNDDALSTVLGDYTLKTTFNTFTNNVAVTRNNLNNLLPQMSSITGLSARINGLDSAVDDNTTAIAANTNAISAETTARTDAITLVTNNMNVLGEAVETNSNNITTNTTAINTNRTTLTSMNSRLVSTINRVNDFTSCDGVQQCYSEDLSIGGTISLPSLPIGGGGGFTWTPINP